MILFTLVSYQIMWRVLSGFLYITHIMLAGVKRVEE